MSIIVKRYRLKLAFVKLSRAAILASTSARFQLTASVVDNTHVPLGIIVQL